MDIDLLFADPDPRLCELYQDYFSRHGLSVTTACDGLDCLTKLRRSKPGILIIDVDLLWGGGDGVLSLMRGDSAFPHLPRVIVTGDETPNQLSQRMHIPVSCCLMKPYRFTVLLERMRALLSRDSADRRAIVASA